MKAIRIFEFMAAFLLSLYSAKADTLPNLERSLREENRIEIAEAQDYFNEARIFPGKITEAQMDSIRLCDKIERRMGDALEYKVGLTNDIRKKPFDSPLEYFIKGEKKFIYVRGERLPESLRLLISVGKDNWNEQVALGDMEVYLIHSEKTRFEFQQRSVFVDRFLNTALYTDPTKDYAYPEGEFVVKEGDGLITQIFKEIGTISRTFMTQIGEALIKRNFQIWVEEIDRTIEIGNEMTGTSVYAYPLNLKKIKYSLTGGKEEKLREIIVNAGEKKILGVVVYYSLKKPHKYVPKLFEDPGKIEYEAFKVYPLDIPLSRIIGKN